MTSEIRTNSIKSRAGMSTVTMTDSGPMFSGITTFVDNSGFTFGVGGGTSIFTPATNVLTFGTNNTEKIRIDANGNANITGVTTAANFKTGVSNLHDVGLTLSGGQIDVGSNIKIGNAGVVTATSFVGDGSALTNLPSGNTDKIEEGNSKVEVVDTGTGSITFVTDGNQKFEITNMWSNFYNGLYVQGSSQFGGSVSVSDSITHLGNSGTRIRFPSNDTITFRTANSERLRITSTGLVGIGTDNPSVLTHIYDSTNTSTSTEQFRISGGNRTADSFETGFKFFTQAPSANGNRHIRFTSNANTGLIIQPHETSTGNAAVDRTISLCPSGGRVEIGANGSAYGQLSLSIPSQSGGSALQVMNTAAGSGDGNLTNIVLRSVNNAGTQWSMADYRAHYHMFSNQGTEVLRTQASGDYGSVETRNIKNGYGGYGIVAGSSNYVFMGDSNQCGIYNDTDNQWMFYAVKGGDTFLYSNGSQTLRSYVTGDYGTIQTIASKNGWGGYSVAGQYNFMATAGACGIYNDIDNEWMAYFARNSAFILYHDGNAVMSSETNGPLVTAHKHLRLEAGNWTGENVGKIQYHTGNLYNQYSTYWIARNASGTNTFTVDSSGNFSSDARKKENITTLTDSLTKVSKLRGVEFNWKEKYGGKKDMGLIAQEVETVFPRLISDSPDPEGAEKENEDGTSMKMMNYNGLFAVAVEAIKELKSKIETLEQENIALRARVTNLEGN